MTVIDNCRFFIKSISILLIVIYLSSMLHAQGSARKPQGITLNCQHETLKSILHKITAQTSIRFMGAGEDIDQNARYSIQVSDESLGNILSALFKNKDIDWKVDGKVVVLFHRSISPSKKAYNDHTISGKVVDDKGQPLPGATIMVKGTQNGVSADSKGEFTLNNVNEDDVLRVTLIGYQPKEISLSGKSIVIQLSPTIGDLNEAIVVAYGTSSQKRNIGAVSTVKGASIQNLPNRSLDRSLQGQVPGLLVTSGSGQPGGGVSNFMIRGIGTGTSAQYGSTVRQPLIVIDGVPALDNNYINYKESENSSPLSNPMAQINPGDIESISVLKDAAAIALYGSKASNGVILITTKKGVSGQSKYNVHHQTDIASPIDRRNDVLSQKEYLELLYESYKNQDATRWTNAAIDADLKSKFPTYTAEDGSQAFYPQQDWFKALYKSVASTVNNEISVQGGIGKTLYFFNVGYLKQHGVLKNTGFDRLSMRYNFSTTTSPWLKLGLNSFVSYSKQRYQEQGEEVDNVSGFPYIASPLVPIRFKDGTYNNTPTFSAGNGAVNNPVAMMEFNKHQLSAYRTLQNIFAEVLLHKDIMFRTVVGADVMFSHANERQDPRFLVGSTPPGVGQIVSDDNLRTRVINTNTVRYSHAFNTIHNVEFLVGQESQIAYQRRSLAAKQNLRVPYLDDLSAGANVYFSEGLSNKSTLLSYFSQLNYDFKGKYLVSLSGRRDGSSKFGIRQRYGNYWSMGAGWVLTEEPFMAEKPFINYLKIRGSVGTSGNSSSIDMTTRFTLLNLGTNNGNSTAYLGNQPGNPDIAWEKSFNSDIGLEFRLLKNRVSGTVDVYNRSISNLLYDIGLPGSSGFINVIDNIGKMSNRGIETSLSVDFIKRKDVSFSLAVNWSTNKNKLIKANQPLATEIYLANKEGENFNSFYLVKWAGVNAEDGKPQWFGNDGKIVNQYPSTARVIVGKPQPDGYGGITPTISYKKLELSAFFYYQYGFQIYDGGGKVLVNDGATFPYYNQSKRALNRWRQPNDIAANPRRVLDNTDMGSENSTRYLYDGDFVRLKTLTLSYNYLPKSLKNIKINQVRFYAMANNLFLLTKYKGIDPENVGVLGNSSASYPQARSYSIGIDLSF